MTAVREENSEQKRPQGMGAIDIALAFVGLAAVLWVFFDDNLWHATILLMVLPPAGLALYLWNETRPARQTGAEKPTFLGIILIPAIGLSVLPGIAFNYIDTMTLWVIVAIATGAATALAFVIRLVFPHLPRIVLGVAAFGVPYFYGSVAMLDVLSDGAPPTIYPAVVGGKYLSASHNSVEYNLQLKPWGPKAMSGNEKVWQEFYDAVRPGDTICMRVHPGYFGIRWYAMNACR